MKSFELKVSKQDLVSSRHLKCDSFFCESKLRILSLFFKFKFFLKFKFRVPKNYQNSHLIFVDNLFVFKSFEQKTFALNALYTSKTCESPKNIH